MHKKTAILLRKFLVGKSSAEEQTELNDWYDQAPVEQPWSTKAQPWQAIKNRMWRQIEAKIKPEASTAVVINKWLRPAIAATVLIAAGISVFFIVHRPKTENILQYAKQDIHVSTSVGELKEVALCDGTHVWLNAKSSISYSKEYGKKLREISLEGEAFFQVARDTLKPFVVNTRYSITRVLGTSFTVSAYPDERQHVGVVSGKVMVKMPDSSNRSDFRLVQGEQVSLDPATNQSELENIDPEQLMSWKDNVLCFDSQALSEVAAILERKFGNQIRVTDSGLCNRQFTGTFDNETLPHILNTISLSMGLTIKQANDTIVEISGN